MRQLIAMAAVAVFSVAIPLQGRELSATNAAELKSAISAAQPGDTIVLQDGLWPDVSVEFVGKGTAKAPITLRAATPGKVVFSGSSTFRIGGEYLVVEGLLFKDPDPTISDLIQFRKDSKQLSKHCRMTNCAVISNLTTAGTKESRWLGLYGADNQVDHCEFSGKTGKGTTFVVWLGGDNQGAHRIDHNYFGPREKIGKNGGETIRIGDSQTSMLDGNCLVEENLFEKCNGETECISNKSCKNIYRGNTFLEVSGTLTLRHGNACLVEGNLFLGNGAGGTGGIRIIGEDHVVRGNYLDGLEGDDARSAISLMMGIPNSPAERYFQVQRARIENNTIKNCEHPILIGLSDDKNASLAPSETLFSGNQISCRKYISVEVRCSLEGVAWKDNRFIGKTLGIAEMPEGISFATSEADIELDLTQPKQVARSEVGTRW